MPLLLFVNLNGDRSLSPEVLIVIILIGFSVLEILQGVFGRQVTLPLEIILQGVFFNEEEHIGRRKLKGRDCAVHHGDKFGQFWSAADGNPQGGAQ